MEKAMEYQVEKSEIVFRGKVFNIRRDVVKAPTGRSHVVDVVDHSGAVTMMPVDDQGRILFVRQYRHATGGYILELPAGTLDPDEAPADCAIRECREEVGMTAGRLIHLGDCYLAPGYSSELNHMYLALDLTPAPLNPDEDEDIRVEPIPLADIQELVARGEVRDGKTLAGLFLALPLLQDGGGAARRTPVKGD
jgi:ADP-ribose pyrophosphatase